MVDLASSIIRYENDQMEEKEEIQFFQHLIDTGLCWKFQGFYGRTARFLIEEGLCIER
jgi:hypothetical protein